MILASRTSQACAQNVEPNVGTSIVHTMSLRLLGHHCHAVGAPSTTLLFAPLHDRLCSKPNAVAEESMGDASTDDHPRVQVLRLQMLLASRAKGKRGRGLSQVLPLGVCKLHVCLLTVCASSNVVCQCVAIYTLPVKSLIIVPFNC